MTLSVEAVKIEGSSLEIGGAVLKDEVGLKQAMGLIEEAGKSEGAHHIPYSV